MRNKQLTQRRIYFDTEFTGLFPDAGLVSIGLVAANEDAMYYAELTDTFVIAECSDFCRKSVLPLLDRGTARKTLAELRIELYDWLATRGPGTTLLCDSPRDVVQLRALFPNGLPPNCKCLVLGRWNRLRRRVVNFRGRLYRKHGLRHHHALDDAKANRMILG